MSYKYAKLRGRIVEVFGTIQRYSDVLGLSYVSVSNKLNGKTGFSQEDIEKWADLLHIEPVYYHEYFFA